MNNSKGLKTKVDYSFEKHMKNSLNGVRRYFIIATILPASLAYHSKISKNDKAKTFSKVSNFSYKCLHGRLMRMAVI